MYYFGLLSFCFLLLHIGCMCKYSKIIGGNNADIKNYPFMVSIRIIQNGQHHCGGAIISNRHVITAAHCFDSYHYSKLKIFTSSNSSIFNNQPNYRILDVNIHPEYTGEISRLNNLNNDIAIATVDRCIEFNQIQNKIDLPTTNIENEGNATIIGWGMTHYPGKLSEVLQEASVMILNNTQCAAFVPLAIHQGQICTYQDVGVGTCVGDNGGPLINNNGKLIGITSSISLCALGEPDVFIRVDHYTEYIFDVLSATYFPSCSIF